MIDLTVYGTPRGKGRPRFVKQTGRAFTDKQTVLAENEWMAAWTRAGEIRLDDGPLQVDLTAVLERPQSHYKTNGELSAAGERSPWPTRKPDWDNLGKLVADALNGKAYRDDSQIVHVVLWKRWASPGEGSFTRVRIRPLEGP
jgi:Holliday junction resolvase RusA-like endonuclease